MELLPYPTEKPHCTLTPEPHQVSFDPIAEKSADPYSNLGGGRWPGGHDELRPVVMVRVTCFEMR